MVKQIKKFLPILYLLNMHNQFDVQLFFFFCVQIVCKLQLYCLKITTKENVINVSQFILLQPQEPALPKVNQGGICLVQNEYLQSISSCFFYL